MPGEGSSRDGMSEIDASDVPPVHVEVEPDTMPARIPSVRRAFESLDSIDLREVFARKAVVMKVPPRFLKGAYCAALRMAMIEVRHGRLDRNVERQLRGWKLFFLVPRLLLHRQARGGLISKNKLRERFVAFAEGRWMELWRECITNEENAREIRSRRGRTHMSDSLGKRVTRAQSLAFMVELSAARTALEGAPCAPGDEFTLRALQDERRRQREVRTPLPLPEDVVNFRPEEAPNLDRDFFLMTLRKARKGAAGGPSGMTAEHLRVLLHNENDSNLLHEMAVDVVKGEIPGPIADDSAPKARRESERNRGRRHLPTACGEDFGPRTEQPPRSNQKLYWNCTTWRFNRRIDQKLR